MPKGKSVLSTPFRNPHGASQSPDGYNAMHQNTSTPETARHPATYGPGDIKVKMFEEVENGAPGRELETPFKHGLGIRGKKSK